MALECSQDAILNFLRERDGRVPNAELVEHFKSIFPEDPKEKAATRELFKSHVDSVAYVKTDNGVKYVCLKKKFREEALKEEKSQQEDSGQVSGRDVGPAGHAAGVHAGSGFTHAEVPHVLETLQHGERAQSECDAGVVKEDISSDTMGNRSSVKREKRESKREENVVEIPVITVSQPSPVPVQKPVFVLPELEQNVNTKQGESRALTQTRRVSTSEELREETHDVGVFSDGEDDGQSLTGSEGTPKNSRTHFIEVMMCTSPQVRRNINLRSFSHSDSDTLSVASCNLEEDRNSVTLDPLEHEWMMCASDAEWESLQRLLNNDPGLVLKKDFITGFTCLHWAAKQGKPELIALIINFAKENNIEVSVDVRSSTGYTPLHVAAMHNHMEVVKLLVGAYNADVEIRDYSGRKACQYLTDNVSVDIRDIIGAYEIEIENKPAAAGKRWRFGKVLHAKPLRRLNSTGDSDTPDGGAGEPVRRRSSLSRMKPKLQKLKWRTSQLVHSTTFHGAEDLEKRQRPRPKTHFFG
ncbi:LOW QUALITY PROTEIN: ankyrin repeat domain-containing protein SOWAHC-like [Boleophthalmus pectinirostris]|uniref:LOW QUALITY PROTEIN: ankyrin repeat domain-containing protein SOWAHC-like n=1 Tax=Boleophthalmus pectinirostris TaxID=150288 RepID=UPI00242D2EFF|nr:LOW QUALITY PROTEIN: ankyrin repeat domain-containing protein SOWAHC-like [Boleophthalmus pectinirostris]